MALTNPITGGAAFPFEGGENNGMQPEFGITTRDYFAAKAMQAHVSALEKGLLEYSHDHVASYAYAMADAMIRAREV